MHDKNQSIRPFIDYYLLPQTFDTYTHVCERSFEKSEIHTVLRSNILVGSQFAHCSRYLAEHSLLDRKTTHPTMNTTHRGCMYVQDKNNKEKKNCP